VIRRFFKAHQDPQQNGVPLRRKLFAVDTTRRNRQELG
jgi:hypothetical protein